MTPQDTPFPELRTARLLLNAFQPADAQAVSRLAGDWELARMTINVPHPYEPHMATKWFATHQPDYANGGKITFAIRSRAEDCLVGCVSLIWKSETMAEIGYWLGRPYWGRGYMTEAAAAVFAYGFGVRRLEKIQARHFSGNPASGRVMQKCGMKHEGLSRCGVVSRGRVIDMAYYGILRGEWRKNQPEGRRECLVLMGVSGSGKTTVGQRLAAELGGDFADADDFHSAANKEKMAARLPLTDEDRQPWLEALQRFIAARSRERPLVVACSALREAYRLVLTPEGQEDIRFVHLDGSPELIAARLRARAGHFMPPELLQSQLATLEPPADAITASIDQPVESVVWEIMGKL